MLITLSLCFSTLGLAALALAIDRHHQQVVRRAPARHVRITLRIAATVLLAASLALAIINMGAPVGIAFWTGSLSPCALAVAFVQSPRKRAADPARRQNALLRKKLRD